MRRYTIAGVDYGRDLDAWASENFQYWEFISSSQAVRLGIKNVPTETEWENIELLVKEVLQPLRTKLGRPVNINSCFRCKALNDAVGSSDTSFHRFGCAADVDSSSIPLMEILEVVYNLPKWSEIIAEFFPDGWVHVAYKAGDTRKILKLKDSSHNFSRVTKEQLDVLYKDK